MKFTKTIEISVSSLGPHFIAEVKRVVVNKSTRSCSRKHGYITDVTDIKVLTVQTEYCTPNLNVIVEFNACTEKPVIGSTVSAAVTTIIKPGIIFSTPLYKVFVPGASGYCENELVDVEIIDTRYDKNQYNCIGKILA